MNVTFDEKTHTYTAEDGKVLPSVTQLVAPLGDDYDEPDDLMEGILDAAIDRGVTMHAYLAHRLSGGDEDDFELPAEYLPYADSVEKFLAEHEIEPLLIEQPLGATVFAGTPDLVCLFDGVEAILDYKFDSSVAKSKVGAQLAGYQLLCTCNGVFPEALYAVQFTRSGYRLYPVGMAEAHTAFSHCLFLYEMKNRKHPRGRIFEGD
jgi:hypothetical protein